LFLINRGRKIILLFFPPYLLDLLFVGLPGESPEEGAEDAGDEPVDSCEEDEVRVSLARVVPVTITPVLLHLHTTYFTMI
jgi:hypothetical protein